MGKLRPGVGVWLESRSRKVKSTLMELCRFTAGSPEARKVVVDTARMAFCAQLYDPSFGAYKDRFDG